MRTPHDWNGIFIMRDGQRDLGGRYVAGLQLTDVAPTILQHFALPVPVDMVGAAVDGQLAGRALLRGLSDGPNG